MDSAPLSWEQYERHKTEQATRRMLQASSVFAGILLLCNLARLHTDRFSSAAVPITGMVIWLTLCRFQRSHQLLPGAYMQCLSLVLVHACGTLGAVLSVSELQCHRFFLTGVVPLTCLSSSMIYMPIRMYVACLVPLHASSWIVFHWYVGFLKLGPIAFGFIIPALTCYVAWRSLQDDWAFWHAMELAKRERRRANMMQNCLTAMFES